MARGRGPPRMPHRPAGPLSPPSPGGQGCPAPGRTGCRMPTAQHPAHPRNPSRPATPGRRIPNRRGRRPARPSGQAQIRTARPAGRSSIPQTPPPAAASGGRTRHPRRPRSGVGPGQARRMRQWMVWRAGTEWRSQRHASSDRRIPGPRRGWSSCIRCSPRSRTRRSAMRIRSMTFPRTATCRWVSCQRSNDCSTATFC